MSATLIIKLSPRAQSALLSEGRLTPFAEFISLRAFTAERVTRFFSFVERSGGDLYTDLSTLSILCDLWEEKERP